jgi:hypothetical protein
VCAHASVYLAIKNNFEADRISGHVREKYHTKELLNTGGNNLIVLFIPYVKDGKRQKANKYLKFL